MPIEYDVEMEATGITNELFYRNGPKAEDLNVGTDDVLLVRDTIQENLERAFKAGSMSDGKKKPEGPADQRAEVGGAIPHRGEV